MRLATSEIPIFQLGRRFTLRPTLRAACNLERRYNGLEPLARAIVDGTLHVIADVIEAGAPDAFDSREELEAALFHNVRHFDSIIPDLLTFLFALAGAEDVTTAEPDAKSDDLMSFADFCGKLYDIGTGWLWWSPEDTWKATPAEILSAYKARADMLKAIFGSAQDDDSDDAPASTTEQKPDLDAKLDSEGLDELRSLGGMGGMF